MSDLNPNIIVDVEEESTGDNPDNDAVNADDMTDRIQILSGLRSKIVEEGVCRDDIEGMNNVLHGFDEAVVSTEAFLYTQDRSRMNLNSALEAIDSGILSMIRRFITKLVQIASHAYQSIRSIFRSAGVATDRAMVYEGMIPIATNTVNVLRDLLGDSAVFDGLVDGLKKRFTLGCDGRYVIAIDPVLENGLIECFNRWDEMIAVAQDAVAESPDLNSTFTESDMSEFIIADYIKQHGNKAPDMTNILTMSFIEGELAPRSLLDKLTAFNDKIKELDKDLKGKFDSSFLSKELETTNVNSTMETTQQLGAFVSGLHNTAAIMVEYMVVRANFRKWLIEFQFELCKGLYKELERTSSPNIEQATTAMQAFISEIKKAKK